MTQPPSRPATGSTGDLPQPSTPAPNTIQGVEMRRHAPSARLYDRPAGGGDRL